MSRRAQPRPVPYPPSRAGGFSCTGRHSHLQKVSANQDVHSSQPEPGFPPGAPCRRPPWRRQRGSHPETGRRRWLPGPPRRHRRAPSVARRRGSQSGSFARLSSILDPPADRPERLTCPPIRHRSRRAGPPQPPRTETRPCRRGDRFGCSSNSSNNETAGCRGLFDLQIALCMAVRSACPRSGRFSKLWTIVRTGELASSPRVYHVNRRIGHVGIVAFSHRTLRACMVSSQVERKQSASVDPALLEDQNRVTFKSLYRGISGLFHRVRRLNRILLVGRDARNWARRRTLSAKL